MITFVRNVFLALGLALSIIGIIDLSARAFIIGLALIAAAHAIHRRSLAFWWVAAAALAIAFCASLRAFFRGPQTPLPFMCSVLSTLTIALISSWWARQRTRFARSPNEWMTDASTADGRDVAATRHAPWALVLLCVFASCAYGVVHDQITIRISPEYFTIAHPPFFPTGNPTLLASAGESRRRGGSVQRSAPGSLSFCEPVTRGAHPRGRSVFD